MKIYTLKNDVNNEYRMGSRDRMREERSRRARRGREEVTKKKEQKNHQCANVDVWGLMSPSCTCTIHIALHSTP